MVVLPEVDEGAEDAGSYAVVGGEVGVVLVARLEVPGGDEAAGLYAVDLVEGVLWFRREFAGGHVLADLDQVGAKPSSPRSSPVAYGRVMFCGVQAGSSRRG